MSRTKAALILDPDRREEQLAYLSERVETLHEAGDQLWVSMTEDQAERLAGQGIAVQLHEEADLIELPAARFDPAAGSPVPPEGLRAASPPEGTSSYHLVQFIAPPDPTWVHEVIRMGGTYIQTLPVNAGVFELTVLQATDVGQLGYVSWVGLYHPAYAISFTLAGRTEPFDAPSLRNLAVGPAGVPPGDGGNIRLRLFDDVSSEEIRPNVEGAATIVAETEYGFVVNADHSRITTLAGIPGVFAVEPFFQPTFKNNHAGAIMNTNQVRNVGNVNFLVNLDGSGEIVGVIDSGLDTGVTPPGAPAIHADLGARVLQITNLAAPGTPARDNAAASGPHGTHVTGSIAGDGTGSAGRVRGVAPNSHVIFHGPLGPNLMPGFRNAHDAGARVHSNSWGTSPSFSCGGNSWPAPTNNRYVIGNTYVIDQFCFANPESLLLFASGNEENDIVPVGGDGTPDMNFLTEEATSKNALTVGAVENVRSNDGDPTTHRASSAPPAAVGACPPIPLPYPNPAWNALAGGAALGFTQSDNAGQLALFSNRGQVQASGGRIKPDLVAPGTNILSLRSTQQPAPPGVIPPHPSAANVGISRTESALLYELMSGTSMATPQVSGAAILARQYYRARFGQMRRPLLLERLSALVDSPAIASHRDGRVAAWVQRDAGQNHLVAARYDRNWARQGGIIRLQTNVGDHPAPALARHGDNTFLVYRAGDNTIKLSLFDASLFLVNGFGIGGTVTLAPASRSEDSRRPGICAQGNEVAVAWNETGGDKLLFRRFRTDNGAPIDSAPQNLGNMTSSSTHPFIAHNGTRYSVVWAQTEGTDRKLRIRQVDSSGTPQGTQPGTLVTQTQDIRDPHLIWDGRQGRFVVVWAGSDASPTGDIRCLFVDPLGSPSGAASTVSTVPAGNTARRPRISQHPEAGYVLLWEDDTQNNRHDVYMAFLDNAGQPDRLPRDPTDPAILAPVARPSRQLLRISDTPENTAGFAGLVDADGVAVVWHSNDEINSDLLGVYGLSLTPLGAFQAQTDPNTPMIDSGRYKNQTLLDHTLQTLTSVSMAWAGGSYYLLRRSPGNILDELHLIRTNADGLVDTTYGTRSLDSGIFLSQHEMHWTGDRLVCASVGLVSDPVVYLLDASGEPVASFGTSGGQSITDSGVTNPAISPQLGHTTQPSFRVIVAYGTGSPQPDIRYAVLNANGGTFVAPLTLARANGTARHGWFHYISSEARSIAAWHRDEAGTMKVFINRYSIGGAKQHASDVPLTTLPGQSMNPVIAARPVDINSSQREYGLAWQYRASGTDPWEIRFSRLGRDGRPMNAAPAPPAPPGGTRDVRVIFAAPSVWPPPGMPAGTDAIEPQLVSTYTHQNWNSARPWSPGYGLAWLGQPSGGNRTLFFTALDENGVRSQLTLPPPYAAGAPRSEAAHIVQISTTGADVREFKLVWNGRTFRLTWTETQGGRLRHMQTALTRTGNRAVYDLPSSSLVRATLINGATNINATPLPNIPTAPITAANRNQGYGWGRVNLRQSLSPSPPVTFHVRDDEAVGSGRRAQYRFYLPPDTRLLRVTLAWTDAPRTDARIANNLHLRVVPPGGVGAGQEFHGNTWAAAPDSHLSRRVAPAAPFEGVHNVEQVVVRDPASGIYDVEVVAEPFPANNFNQLRVQPFALVFVGSGQEVLFGPVAPAGPIPVY
ncbi:MAG TPA: S8 family serine peptidase [Rubrobacteraceae bacterium]|nr:S8 family serine peptidase [Rubrobacteraceae bacterium]